MADVGPWQRRMVRGLLGLPPAVQRRLAGHPVVRDGQTLDPETQWMLRLERIAHEPAAETLPLSRARAALRRQSRLVGGNQPIGSVRDLEVPGPAGPLRARLYTPRSRLGQDAAPLLFFVHGGGWVFCDLDTHDPMCRFLAERAQVRVLSVDYRLAPEHPFPAAVDDCLAAYAWVAGHGADLGVDPDRVAVGGDSAGGTLSAVTAVHAARQGVPCAYQVLLYPATDMLARSRSRETFAQGFFLTREFMDLADRSYLPDGVDRRDPRVSPLHLDEVPTGLAPALVVTAGFDPLRDEGEAYAVKLADAGIAVQTRRYPGLIHGFANTVGAGRSSKRAVTEVAGRIRDALSP